jgi:hypothetical protein
VLLNRSTYRPGNRHPPLSEGDFAFHGTCRSRIVTFLTIRAIVPLLQEVLPSLTHGSLES